MLLGLLETAGPEVWIILIAFLIFLMKEFKRLKNNLPPGPAGLPFIGYFPFLTENPHLKLFQLAKKYGDVFSIHLGSAYVVILNDVDTIREAFSKRELLGRPPNSPLGFFGFHTPFFSTNVHTWQEQRRFVVKSMKDLGLGNSKMEDLIQVEIHNVLNALKESKGKPINLEKPLTPSMSNNICSLLFGERYNYTESSRIMLDHVLGIIARTLSQTSSLLFLPWLENIPFFASMFKYDKIFEAFAELENFIGGKIRTHKETLDPENSRSFIDSYILEMKARTERNLKTSFSDEYLTGLVVNLFLAGSETVRSTITWSMYIMAAFPERQEKVRKEIQEVLGSSTDAQFRDQLKMPYTQALIREIMRWKTVTPLGIFRCALNDVNVAGYNIPKGSIVVANLWFAHHDARYWKDPDSFRPERFLDEDGNLIKDSHFIPFSVGKKSCPGEYMAMMEIFLYFVSILQKFTVSFPPGFQPTFEVGMGVTYHLQPSQICFIPVG